MQTIRNYTNTLNELNIAKTRLNWLLNKKEMLYCKYFPVTKQLKEIMVDGGHDITRDSMADYMHELTTTDTETGKSLEQEIQDQRNIVQELEYYLRVMDYSLKELTGIEYELYYEIIHNGLRISQAVRKIADKFDKDDSTIWRIYHKSIKADINKLKKC